jgi:hypothetical protein
MLAQLRFGRGVDNRRYKAAGFHYQYTSRETVLALEEHFRLEPIVRGAQEPYRYEREVEEFLRWSPHVRQARERGSGLSRDQVVELQRLLAGYAETAGIELERAPEDDRVAAAEARALAAERVAAEAMERVAEAERRAREAVERASRAERRAQEDVERPAPQPEPQPEPQPAPPPEPRPEPRPPRAPLDHYDDLPAEKVIALLDSLEPADLQSLRDYERRHANRTEVVEAIESVLARGGSPV